MMTIRFDMQSISAGLLAGLATVILCLGVATGSGLAVILYFLSPLPIMLAGLGWGAGASITAVIAAAAGLTALANGETALFIIMTTALPSALAAWWLTLSRPADELGGPKGKIAWYPMADVLLRLAGIVGIAFVITGILIGYGDELVTQLSEEIVNRLRETNPEFAFTPEAQAQFGDFLTRTIPLVQPAMWLLVLVANLYLAIAVSRMSGRLDRPRDYWPLALRMPRAALGALGVALVGSFFSGGLGLAATALMGALLGGYLLAGFAFVHERTAGKPWQPLALIILYFSILLVGFPLLVVLVLGLFATARNIPVSNPNNPGGGNNAPDD